MVAIATAELNADELETLESLLQRAVKHHQLAFQCVEEPHGDMNGISGERAIEIATCELVDEHGDMETVIEVRVENDVLTGLLFPRS